MSRDSFYPFYGWLIIVGLILFGAYLLWDLNLLQLVIKDDITYLSAIILALFSLVTCYLGIAAWGLAKQTHATTHFENNPAATIEQPTKAWVTEHLQFVKWQREHATNESEPLLARLVDNVHRGHSSGWFLSDILMRLGLIGTVIGFVLMLSTVYQLKENDVDALQQLLSTMGSGMRVALFTTLTGLGTALLISVQCQWLDRCADNLIGRIIALGMNDVSNMKNRLDSHKESQLDKLAGLNSE